MTTTVPAMCALIIGMAIGCGGLGGGGDTQPDTGTTVTPPTSSSCDTYPILVMHIDSVMVVGADSAMVIGADCLRIRLVTPLATGDTVTVRVRR